jgi:hypothetical protein
LTDAGGWTQRNQVCRATQEDKFVAILNYLVIVAGQVALAKRSN